MKKLICFIVSVMIILGTTTGCGIITVERVGDVEQQQDDAVVETVEEQSEIKEKAEAEVATEETAKEEKSESKTVKEKLSFTLVAGEQGEYGHPFSINVGTEFEENYFVYRIPEGTYKATNVGKYMDQINVYSDEIHVTEAGWEEKTPFFVALLNVNESTTFTIEEGQHVDICKPAEFLLEKQ